MTTLFRSIPLVALVAATAASFACSGSSKTSGFIDPNADDGGSSSGGPIFGQGGDGSASGPGCNPNPANAEIADNNCDDDANGKTDDVPTCDTGLATDGAADQFAKAIGICDDATTRGFGLVSATYSNGYGKSGPPAQGQWGILARFGNVIVPREGKMLGALSSGYAREFDTLVGGQEPFDPGAILDGDHYPTGAAPPGYPKAASGCQQDNVVNDTIDVKLVLRAPPNAQGIKFDFDFHSAEWPAYVCSNFNDAFIAFLTSKAFNNGQGDNISFDSKNSPVSVNNGFFDRCTPNSPTGCLGDGKGGTAACPGGPSELAGTGFGLTDLICDFNNEQTKGGATGWLTTQAPVQAGEDFTIEFMIWDAGDGILDSTVLLDKFQWIGGAVTTGTTRPPR